MNIVIPEKLRKAMEQYDEISWSEIAVEAFRRKIAGRDGISAKISGKDDTLDALCLKMMEIMDEANRKILDLISETFYKVQG